MRVTQHSRKSNDVSPAQVGVWTWSLDVGSREQDGLLRLLSPDERMRAARFVQSRDRRRWVVAHGRMRQVLGRILQKDPVSLVFVAEGSGRPVLGQGQAEPASYSLSHSEAVGALAVSNGVRVGVDVEAVRPMGDDEMAAALSALEWRRIRTFHGDARLAAFFRLWTAKEAFVKALGTGLATPLTSFDIDLLDEQAPAISRWDNHPDAGAHWRFASARPAEGYVCTVAAKTAGRPLNVVWRKEDDGW